MAAQSQDCVPVTKPAEPLTVADHTTDVVFVVEEKQIHFTKLLLTLCSPVFDRMFHGDFAEKSSKEIPLPGKSYTDMVTFLKLIHPAHSTSITDDKLLSLLELSREYQVESVRNKCEQFIGTEVKLHAAKKLTADRFLLFLYACDEYNLTKHVQALKKCAQAEKSADFRVCNNFKKFCSTPSFIEALISRCESAEQIVADVKDAFGTYRSLLLGEGRTCNCKNTFTCNNCRIDSMKHNFRKVNKKIEAFHL